MWFNENSFMRFLFEKEKELGEIYNHLSETNSTYNILVSVHSANNPRIEPLKTFFVKPKKKKENEDS